MLFNRNIRIPPSSTSGILAPAVPDAFDALLAHQNDLNAKSLEPLFIDQSGRVACSCDHAVRKS